MIKLTKQQAQELFEKVQGDPVLKMTLVKFLRHFRWLREGQEIREASHEVGSEFSIKLNNAKTIENIIAVLCGKESDGAAG